MAWSLIASTKASGNSGGATTPGINCAGSDLIVVAANSFNVGTFSDSSSNTWSSIGPISTTSAKATIFYSFSPTTSASQTFTYSGVNTFPGLAVIAWAGSIGSGTVDQTNSANALTVSTLATGSITPTNANSLVIADLAFIQTISNLAISVGIIQQNLQWVTGVDTGAAIASLVQGAAAPVNPSWSWTTASNAAAIVASFPPAVLSATQLSISKNHSIFNSTEITVAMPGLSTSQAILTDGLPFGTVELSQASGTAITSVLMQQSNDGATWVNQGTAVTVPTVQDLYTGTSPSKFVRFLVNGGDTTSVVNILLELMGTRG